MVRSSQSVPITTSEPDDQTLGHQIFDLRRAPNYTNHVSSGKGLSSQPRPGGCMRRSARTSERDSASAFSCSRTCRAQAGLATLCFPLQTEMGGESAVRCCGARASLLLDWLCRCAEFSLPRCWIFFTTVLGLAHRPCGVEATAKLSPLHRHVGI